MLFSAVFDRLYHRQNFIVLLIFVPFDITFFISVTISREGKANKVFEMTN